MAATASHADTKGCFYLPYFCFLFSYTSQSVVTMAHNKLGNFESSPEINLAWLLLNFSKVQVNYTKSLNYTASPGLILLLLYITGAQSGL